MKRLNHLLGLQLELDTRDIDCLPEGEAHDFGRLQATAARLRADHRAHSLSDARSSVLSADLRVAGVRSLPEISPAQSISRLLAREIGRASAFGDGGARPPHQAGGNPRAGRQVSPELAHEILALLPAPRNGG